MVRRVAFDYGGTADESVNEEASAHDWIVTYVRVCVCPSN
jgi:hypothetical protein